MHVIFFFFNFLKTYNKVIICITHGHFRSINEIKMNNSIYNTKLIAKALIPTCCVCKQRIMDSSKIEKKKNYSHKKYKDLCGSILGLYPLRRNFH